MTKIIKKRFKLSFFYKISLILTSKSLKDFIERYKMIKNYKNDFNLIKINK